VFVVSPNTCFTDTAGTIPAGNNDLVRAIRGIVNNTLLTQTSDSSCPVLELDSRGYWSLRCNGVKFLESASTFTASGVFSAAISMNVLTLTGSAGLSHVIGPISATNTVNGVFVRASATGGASQVSGRLRISGGTQFDAMYSSAFLTNVPFTTIVTHDNVTLQNRRGNLFYASIAASVGAATAQVPLRLGINSTYDARIYGGMFINRTLTSTEAYNVETRLRLDTGITPVNTATVGQLSASLRPLLGQSIKTRRNLFRATENFADSAWAIEAVTVEGAGPDFKIIPTVAASRHSIAQSFAASDLLGNGISGTRTITIEVKADGYNRIGVAEAVKTGAQSQVLDLQSGTLVSTGSGTTSIELLSDGWHRLTWTSTFFSQFNSAWRICVLPNSGIDFNQIYNKTWTGDGVSGIRVRYPHAEIGAVRTQYQTVDNTAIVVSEMGNKTYPFMRFDMSDDRLDTVLPQAVTGDLIIAGKSGTIIEPVSYTANTNFQLGVNNSYTGGTPGILRAIGDVVGYSLIGRSLSDLEKSQILEYYKSRGAKGKLRFGSNLVENGTFSNGLAGWTTGAPNGTYEVTNNILRITATQTSPWAGITKDVPYNRGYFHLLRVTINNTFYNGYPPAYTTASHGGGTGFSVAYIGTGTYSIISNASVFYNAFLRIGISVSRNAGNPLIGDWIEVSNVELYEIRPEEEW
jgi:hypothetical protein